jgi:hypothetical protein
MPSTFNYLMVALGTGTGSVSSLFVQVTADNGTHCITSADFNNDGNMDLATATNNSTIMQRFYWEMVRWFWNACEFRDW